MNKMNIKSMRKRNRKPLRRVKSRKFRKNGGNPIVSAAAVPFALLAFQKLLSRRRKNK